MNPEDDEWTTERLDLIHRITQALIVEREKREEAEADADRLADALREWLRLGMPPEAGGSLLVAISRTEYCLAQHTGRKLRKP